MLFSLSVSVILLAYGACPINGQCTTSTCKYLFSDSEESRTIMEHLGDFEEKFKLMYEDLSARLQLMNASIVTAFERKIQTMNEKLNAALIQENKNIQYTNFQDYCRDNFGICDCSTISANGFTTNGVYRIYVDYQYQRYYANAFCDMTTSVNNAWTVFQKRKDGSEDFYRGWNDYAYGFGNPNREFWLGNEFLHFLTSKRRYRLRIELEEFDGQKAYAEYSTFSIGSSVDKYRLTAGNYSGNAGDSLSYHSGRRFSTKDQDNDEWSYGDCAVTRHGAWWYLWCHYSNLNGFYYRSGKYSSSSISGNGTEWYHWRNKFGYSLKATEMKISPY